MKEQTVPVENKPDTLEGAELLFGVFGWLTSRAEPITLSSNHNASAAVDLIARFCKANGIPDTCRPAWQDRLTHPPVLEGEAVYKPDTSRKQSESDTR